MLTVVEMRMLHWMFGHTRQNVGLGMNPLDRKLG